MSIPYGPPTQTLDEAYRTARDKAETTWTRPRGDPDQRIPLTADAVWETGYRLAHTHAYTEVAERVRDAVGNVGTAERDADIALGSLSGVTRLVVDGPPPLVPPAPQTTLDAAATAANRPGLGLPSWLAITHLVWDHAVLHGALHGVLHAAEDILAGWHQVTSASLRAAAFENSTVAEWVHATLAKANWQTVQQWNVTPPQGWAQRETRRHHHDQRTQRDVEDLVLREAGRLDPTDSSPPARLLREVAGSITEHREAAQLRREQDHPPAIARRAAPAPPAAAATPAPAPAKPGTTAGRQHAGRTPRRQ